jgi:hypothetical protein
MSSFRPRNPDIPSHIFGPIKYKPKDMVKVVKGIGYQMKVKVPSTGERIWEGLIPVSDEELEKN